MNKNQRGIQMNVLYVGDAKRQCTYKNFPSRPRTDDDEALSCRVLDFPDGPNR